MGNGRIVPFALAPLWLLDAPAQPVEQPANVVDVVLNAKHPLNHFCHPRTRPKVVPIAIGSGPFSNAFVSCCFCFSLSRAGRPAFGVEFKPASPAAR